MVRLKEEKQKTEHQAIKKLIPPAKVYIPLSQHLGKICEPLVKAGDNVIIGQKIASIQAHVFANIHASVSGTVTAIQDWPHPVLGRSKAIVIENDNQGRVQDLRLKTQEEIQQLTPEQIRNIVFEAGIVGMGGASFPTHIKLNPPKPVDTLIINGAECEPYLTGDYRLMVEKTKEILQSIELVKKCLGVKKVYIGIEDNKPEAIEAFRTTIHHTPYTIQVLKSQYPQGGEKQLIKNVLGKEVPSGKLPFDVGVVVHNVATIYAIYEVAYLRKPLYERVITLTGDCLENPGNFLVRIGTPAKDLLNQCGQSKQELVKVIFGGPMMGLSQYSLDTPVIKSTNGIIFFSKSGIETIERALCVRCSRCVQHCPAGLMPCLIALSAEKEKWDLSKAYNCLDCIECGLCNYICPQKINIVQLIKLAKTRIIK